jgi:hypothetical protein
MKNAIFWDITPCGSYKNKRFGEMYCFHHPSDKNRRGRNLQLATEALTIYDIQKPGNTEGYGYLCGGIIDYAQTNKKQTPWPLVRKLTIPTERPPLAGET